MTRPGRRAFTSQSVSWGGAPREEMQEDGGEGKGLPGGQLLQQTLVGMGLGG